ncbi:ankyrin repeat-containing protein ITN1-like [Rhododendron vialii]|uniref:ankyrin repeat-containing protein ITN1-like n=1 Tax=Rhododendron vialii TaxID=182163 RepID=UPI00265FDBE6|nr:ankyrin repeat-containing protein ITN1-like [Rhododendron vialii]
MTTARQRGERNIGEREDGIRERMQSKRETWKDTTVLEEWLCDAAIRGDVDSLKEIMTIDGHILHKVLVGNFKGKNPLHIATSTGQTKFVEELLNYKQDLAHAVDKELGTALHIASSKGHLDIVEHLVKVSPEMCVARDREGNNPLHIAAMNGNDEVLKVLLRTNPRAALLLVDRGDNILHLCVNYNQLASLKLLLDVIGDEFASSTDVNGNNILHLAVFGKRCEIIKYLLPERPMKEKNEGSELGQLKDVNARNGSGWTALDIHSRVVESESEKSEDEKSESEKSEDEKSTSYHDIGDVLRASGVNKSDKLFFPFDPYWEKKKNETLMIVSSLMATILFQVGIIPPGSVWADSSPEHKAGKAIIAYTNPRAYSYLMFFNTVGFLLSLTTIFELIVVLPTKIKAFGFIRAGVSWLTIMIMAFAYTFSVFIVSPTEMYKSVNLVIFVTAIVWAVGISFLHVLPYKVQSKLLGVIVCPLNATVKVLLCFARILFGCFECCFGCLAVCLACLAACATAPALATICKWAADSESPPSTPTVQSAGDTASPPIGAVSQNDSRIVSIQE